MRYVQPFAVLLYPLLMDWSQQLDDHHGFVVEYELGKDTNLGFHVDDSEVHVYVLIRFNCSVVYIVPARTVTSLNVRVTPTVTPI